MMGSVGTGSGDGTVEDVGGMGARGGVERGGRGDRRGSESGG